MQLAILPRDIEEFLLGLVAILALPKTVSPFAEQRGVSGELAVMADDVIELGTVKEVIIDRISDFGTQVEGA